MTAFYGRMTHLHCCLVFFLLNWIYVCNVFILSLVGTSVNNFAFPEEIGYVKRFHRKSFNQAARLQHRFKLNLLVLFGQINYP